MRTQAAAGIVATALLLPLGAASAHATGVDDLPEITLADRDASVGALDLNVHRIDLSASISDVERESSSSGTATLDSDILFGFDKDMLGPEASQAIAGVVQDIPKKASVTITGYTDDVGEDAYNTKLSTRRAQAVKKAVAKTRPDLRITARGRGSADPVEPNEEGGKDNPEGRAQNRRVEITSKS